MLSHSILLALGGGALIGLASSLVHFAHGRVAGVSGILADALRGSIEDRSFRLAFLAGLLGAGIIAWAVAPSTLGGPVTGLLPLALAGLLVGVGVRLGNGCTSGHGVCGVARLSVRSILATLTFMATGFATVFVVRHVLGGAS